MAVAEETVLAEAANKQAAGSHLSIVVDGLNRAVDWVRSHPESVRTGLTLQLSEKTGVSVRFGYSFQGDERTKLIRELLKGRSADTATNMEGDTTFIVVDSESGLTFHWTEWKEKQHRVPDTENGTITL